MMEQILMSLAKLAPVVAILIAAVYYFLNKEKGYKVEIASLNEQLRKNEKDSLELMSKMAATMDKFIENDHRNKDEIIREIKQLKETLATKIDNLK